MNNELVEIFLSTLEDVCAQAHERVEAFINASLDLQEKGESEKMIELWNVYSEHNPTLDELVIAADRLLEISI